jgi:hypothetical protein
VASGAANTADPATKASTPSALADRALRFITGFPVDLLF